ncbi:MAG: TrkH family potassium uptake protein [Muribaculaceae bacterium]|nr:TrkH family potassium uptake protein [Muribaculaceae bacterium]
MLAPLAVSIFNPGESCIPYLICIGITGGSGVIMMALRQRSSDMGKREAIVLTASTWVILSLFGMLPFLLTDTLHSVTDAFFETISGFTTTGASVLSSLNNVPKSILVWRCVTQWIGGLGIILFTLAVVPMLNSPGGMQMFNAEVTGITHDKLRPRVSYTAKGLWGIYAILTALLVILLNFSDMGFYDSLCYGLSTMSTGGFPTTDAGIHAMETVYVKIVMIIFMFLGGVNFALIFNSVTGYTKGILNNTPLKAYLICIGGGTVLFIIDQLINKTTFNWSDLSLDPLFQSVSILSSTGIAEPDFHDWGSLSVVVMIIMMVIGACAGSTSGGAKIDRIVILLRFLKNEFYKMMHPGAVTTVIMNGKGTTNAIVNKTLAFLFIYIFTIIAGGLALSLLGLNLSDGLYCALQAISNTGLGSDATGVYGDYSHIAPAGKWILGMIMLIGRLEIFTVLLLFTPSFWRR